MQFTMYTVVLLLVAIGGKSIVLGSMATGELTSVIVYALQILMSLSMVTFVFVMIMIAEASADRITEVLKEVPEMKNKENAAVEVQNGDIVFDHVNFSYGGKGGNLSLKDINLHIRSGQTIGIIGGTGSAKSTLVQMIPRLYDVTDGSVKVGGIDVRDYNLEALRDQVSWCFRRMCCFPVQFTKTFAGVMKMPVKRKYRESVSLRRQTVLSMNFRQATILRLFRRK